MKKTVTRRKDLRPQTSDKAPINGAQRKDKIPCKIYYTINTFIYFKVHAHENTYIPLTVFYIWLGVHTVYIHVHTVNSILQKIQDSIIAV